MRLRRNEILAATAVVMYIVFFAASPPAAVRTVLANPLGMVAMFGAALYVTVKLSKVVGGLLITAFVLSMTHVTEHLTAPPSEGSIVGCTNSAAYGIIEAGKFRVFADPTVATSYSPTWSSSPKVDCATLTQGTPITSAKAAGADVTPSSPPVSVTGPAPVTPPAPTPVTPPAPMPTSTPAPSTTTTPPATLPGPSATPQPSTPPAPVPPATPPPTATIPPRPVMSCNLESFASF